MTSTPDKDVWRFHLAARAIRVAANGGTIS